MEIITVKENGLDSNTYKVTLLGGTVLNAVPKANGNKDYAIVQEWIANGGVVEPFETQAEIDARLIEEANAAEYELLAKLDRESIRDIREWLASQPTAPQTLKDREAQAIAARGRIQ